MHHPLQPLTTTNAQSSSNDRYYSVILQTKLIISASSRYPSQHISMCQKYYALFECGHAKVIYEFFCPNKAGLEEVCPVQLISGRRAPSIKRL